MNERAPEDMAASPRLRMRVRGAVQGVGFRPFVHGLAREFALDGFVRNDAEGVLLEIQGARVNEFVDALRRDPPPLARIDRIELRSVPPKSVRGFSIEPSADGENRDPHRSRRRRLRELSRRSVRSKQPLLSLSLRQLHALRAALHADAASAL